MQQVGSKAQVKTADEGLEEILAALQALEEQYGECVDGFRISKEWAEMLGYPIWKTREVLGKLKRAGYLEIGKVFVENLGGDQVRVAAYKIIKPESQENGI